MKRGDIHVVAARGAYSGKPRPVVILQDDRFDATNSVTVCPVATTPTDAPLIRVAVEPAPINGLEQSSWLMVDKVATVPRSNIRDRIGRLADADLIRLNRAVVVFLGLAS